MFSKDIFNTLTSQEFDAMALQVFKYQFENNEVYRRFSQLLNRVPDVVHSVEQIPFLPISFFKTHKIVSGTWTEALIFESSGTTGMQASRHYVKDLALYEKSFTEGFRYFYGDPKNYCFLALLPSYLERKGSSLIYMIKKLMELSGHPENGFCLYNHDELKNKLTELEKSGQKSFLFGVTYALLDFSETYSMQLQNTVIMETGGMKGRRKELIRSELHEILCQRFGVKNIHSEYGMAELLSQAYSQGNGLFETPPWMKILIRNPDDPLTFSALGKTGGINVIDLANIHSCAFIATQDLGRVFSNGAFEVSGRFDESEVRGCNLLVI